MTSLWRQGRRMPMGLTIPYGMVGRFRETPAQREAPWLLAAMIRPSPTLGDVPVTKGAKKLSMAVQPCHRRG
jgi:hypothetical protein